MTELRASDLENVPIFPLPQMVLLPGALMPLHIFEPRYRAMTAAALAGERLLVLAYVALEPKLLNNGHPRIEPIAGLGRIEEEQQLPDGRYNLSVRGLVRVHVEEHPFTPPYRRGAVRVLKETDNNVSPLELRALVAVARQVVAAVRPLHPKFDVDLSTNQGPGPLVDRCAHALVVERGTRQKLLATLSVRERAELCMNALLTQQSTSQGGTPAN